MSFWSSGTAGREAAVLTSSMGFVFSLWQHERIGPRTTRGSDVSVQEARTRNRMIRRLGTIQQAVNC